MLMLRIVINLQLKAYENQSLAAFCLCQVGRSSSINTACNTRCCFVSAAAGSNTIPPKMVRYLQVQETVPWTRNAMFGETYNILCT